MLRFTSKFLIKQMIAVSFIVYPLLHYNNFASSELTYKLFNQEALSLWSKNIRIALIGTTDVVAFPVENYGGVPIAVEQLAWGMHDAGLNFMVIACKNHNTNRSFPFTIYDTGWSLQSYEDNIFSRINCILNSIVKVKHSL
jgi:hypothetical protein